MPEKEITDLQFQDIYNLTKKDDLLRLSIFDTEISKEKGVSIELLSSKTNQLSVADSGGFEGSSKIIKLDSTNGSTANFRYSHLSIPDNFIIRYEGKNILETGFVSGTKSGSVEIPQGSSDELEILLVTDNTETQWSYNVNIDATTSLPKISIEDAHISVASGSNRTAKLRFSVTLSKPSNKEVSVQYSTLAATAVDGTIGTDRIDYQPVTDRLTFLPGQTTKNIEITVYGDTPVNWGNDSNFEIFAREIAYRDWNKGQDADSIDGERPYGDLGYRIDKFFNNGSDFQAAGLTSDESLFVVLSDPINGEINSRSQEDIRLQEKLIDLVGAEKHLEVEVSNKIKRDINALSKKDTSWTFATGTIYDEGREPVLAVRGTQELPDFLSDVNPLGIGFDQFEASIFEVSQWLKKTSNPEENLSYKPHITGHSLGGALAQWIAASYAEQHSLGDVITFNSPGIARSVADKFTGADKVKHYITSTDIVSLAGFRYLAGSQFAIANETFSIFKHIPVIGPHTHPVLIPFVVRTQTERPANLSLEPDNSVNELEFSYLPDPDYFAFLLGVSRLVPVVGPPVAAALRDRGIAETSRLLIGAALQEVISTLKIALELDREVITAAFEAAKTWIAEAFIVIKNWEAAEWTGASVWGSEAWNATRGWAEDAWNATIGWPSEAWNATTQWTEEIWNAALQWPSDAWNATTQWSNEFWISTIQWPIEAWNATIQWPTEAWNATTKWINSFPFLGKSTSILSLQQQESNVSQNLISNPLEAIALWSSAAWEATALWSDAAWRATTQWDLQQWQQTTSWTDNMWLSTTKWTDDIWNSSAEIRSALNEQILFGTQSIDAINGTNANEIIDGLAEDDLLSGNGGDDILRGGAGNDRLYGGTGSDKFNFGNINNIGIDTIYDFASSEGDTIVVSPLSPNLLPGPLPENKFFLGIAAEDVEDRFIYDRATGNLLFDPDGTGSDAPQIVVTFANKPILQHDDIIVSTKSSSPLIKLILPSKDTIEKQVLIEWNAFDVDSDAKISLFYDDDNKGLDGQLIIDGLVENDGKGSFLWDTTSLPKDDYYIYAKIDDNEHNPKYSYSRGKVAFETGQFTDISITKAINESEIGLGGRFEYLVEIENSSPYIAENVVLTETLPEPVRFRSSNFKLLDKNENSLVFEIGNILPGETKTGKILVNAPILQSGLINLRSDISSTNKDLDTSNNIASLEVQVVSPLLPDLKLIRNDEGSEQIRIGEEYSYSLTILNEGKGVATDVVIKEFLTSGVDYIRGDFFKSRSSPLALNLANILPGESKTINLTVVPIQAGILPTRTLVSSRQSDIDLLDNFIVNSIITNSITPENIDLELTATSSNLDPISGEDIFLTLALTNKGPGVATNVRVQNSLPSWLTFKSSNSKQGNYDSATGIWDVGNMRDSLSRELVIAAEVNSNKGTSSSAYSAQVISASEADIDSVPNNNLLGEDDQVELVFENSGQNILGTDGRDTLIGTQLDDVIIGMGGRDELIGGEGADLFVYQSLSDRFDRIKDFQIGQDKIVLTELLRTEGIENSDFQILENQGFIVFEFIERVVSGRKETRLKIDPDGAIGRRNPRTLLTVENIDKIQLNNADNFLV